MPQPIQLAHPLQDHVQYSNEPEHQYPIPVSGPLPAQYYSKFPAPLSTPRPQYQPAPRHCANYLPPYMPQYHRSNSPPQSRPYARPRSEPRPFQPSPPYSGPRHGPFAPPPALPLIRRSPTTSIPTPPQTPSPHFTPNPIELKAGKIYYLPHSGYIPVTSIVRGQKRQEGFWQHPVLVVLVDDNYAHFYALTRTPPSAVRDLNMCLRLGITSNDEGPGTLKLAPGSGGMTHQTWVNLEQRFKIELGILTHWTVEVQIDPAERLKLQARVDLLEAEQNRFIYKPLDRNLDNIAPGTVLLMKNHPGASTLGAPVLILENQFPRFRFLRIKEKKKSSIWDEPLSEYGFRSRQMALTISRELRYGHEGTPVMLLTAESPDLREESYAELTRKAKWGTVHQFGTWCVPSVQLQPHSMKVMLNYMSNLPESAPHCPRQAPGLYPEVNLGEFLYGIGSSSSLDEKAVVSSIGTGSIGGRFRNLICNSLLEANPTFVEKSSVEKDEPGWERSTC